MKTSRDSDKAGSAEVRYRLPRSVRSKLGMTLIVMSLFASAAGVATWSAFSATTENSGNSFDVGTVFLTDNDSNGVLLSLVNARPGDNDAGCIKVTYGGTLAASIRLYGSHTFSGGDVAPYLNLTVTRGTFTGAGSPPAFKACSGGGSQSFTADASTYIAGKPDGVVYDGTLAAYPTSYTDPAVITDPNGSWANGEAHIYKFSITVADDINGQGKNATQTFTWEARNN